MKGQMYQGGVHSRGDNRRISYFTERSSSSILARRDFAGNFFLRCPKTPVLGDL